MVIKNAKCVHLQDIVFLYSDLDKITRFRQNIRFSSTRHKEDVILEPCSEMKKANMDNFGGLSAPYFYLHLPAIHELGILIPFVPFEAYFLATTNFAPSQITTNV